MKLGLLCKPLTLMLLFIGFVEGFSTDHYEDSFQIDEKYLVEVLDEISAEHNVFFTYDSEMIKGIKVEYEKKEGESVRSILTRVLKEVDLGFKIFEQRFVIIYKNNEEGIQSLEKMIAHLEGIVTEKKNTIAIRRNARTIEKLNSRRLNAIGMKRLVINVGGKVINQQGEPLIGVNVVVKGTDKGTATDFNGEYMLEDVDENAVLVFSYIGYQSQEVKLSGRQNINITLVDDSQTLDELVVVGYQTEHKRDVTAAVTSIRSEDIENIPVTSISSLLATQSTGIQNVTLSGAPGARGAVMIRGNTSISGDLNANTAFSNPLYVIDGVQTSLEDLAGYNVSNTDFLASLNPSDIESIDILKDASAAAIYGSRGANGVIIIKTKKGTALDKPEFTFTANYGVMPEPDLIPMLAGAAERRAKMNMINTWWKHDVLLSDEVPIMLTDSLNPAFNNNNDYQGLFYQTGIRQKYNFSMRGGSEESNYRLSLGYDDNVGTVTATGFDRYTLSGNINSKVGERFRNQLIANVVFTDNQTGQGNPYNPNLNAYNLNNTLPVNPAGLNSSLFYLTEERRQSLVGELDDKFNTDRAFSTTFSNYARLEVLDGLSINSQLSFVYSSNKKNFYEPSTIRPESDGRASYSLYNRKNISSDLYASYFKDLGSHNITGIIGQKVDYNQYEDMGLEAIGFGSDAIQVINSRYQKDEIIGYTDLSENALLSYFARFSYKYKHRYILAGSFSIDGSSRFGVDNRWAKFPSVSVGWVFSEEPFIKPFIADFVDFAKLRLSWGINGKQFTENYLRFGSYDLGYGGTGGFNTNQMVVSSYGGTTGVVPNYNAIGNNELSWENSTQWNIGLELDMFDQRLSITFDAYNKLTDRLFFDIEFPSYSGYNNAKANVAGILNYGWESMVRYHVFPRTNDLRLELSTGLSANRNFINKLPNGNRDYNGSDYGYVVGRPINLYKMFINEYIVDDLDQLPANPYTGEALTGKSAWAAIRPGFPIWKDLNGDYLLNETHDQQLVREFSPVPDLQGSFNINLQYKAWYFRMYSQFSFGADIKNTVLNSYMDAYDRGGTNWATRGLADLSAYSFWEKPGDGAAGARFPALYPSGAGLGPFYGFRGNQTLWIESGDYWKITNASIGYTFGTNSFINRFNLTRLRIYASGLNLYQWQRSKAVVDASLVDAKGHVLGNGYPQASTYSFGIDLRF